MWKSIVGIIAAFAALFGLAAKFLGLDQADSSLWVTIPLGIAVVGAVLWLILSHRAIGRLAASRSARYGVNMFALSVIVIFIAVMLNVIVTGKRVQWDTTSNQRNSIAPQSQSVVEALGEEILVTAHIPPEMDRSPLAPINSQIFNGLMEMYRSQSSLVSYRIIDARRNPQDAEGLPSPVQPGDIFVTLGDRTEKVEPYRASNLEEKITRAMIAVTREGESTVYFLTRRGEAIFESDQTGQGLDQLRDALETELYGVETIDLLEAGEVPEDCSVLFIADSSYQFTDADLSALTAYLNRGGQVIACVDIEPLLMGLADSALVPYLEQFGCEVGTDIAIEQSLADISLRGNVSFSYSPDFSTGRFSRTNDITRDLFDPVEIRMARSVSADDLPRGVDADLLLSASPSSWAEQGLDMFKLGRVSVGDDAIQSSVPIAQIFTVEVADHPAVFTPVAPEVMTEAAPTQPLTLIETSPEEVIQEPTEPLEISPVEPDLGLSLDDVPMDPGGSVDGGREPEETEEPEPVPPARILVIGDSTLLADALMVPGLTGNRDFILNAVGYLASETDLIAIRPRDTINTGFTLSPFRMRVLVLILLGMPLVIALMGAVVQSLRRRAA
ncbi:GldG family protein [Candidatus Sumerlaeota bacterium]|nr:GldG family protein [Candidatus Sumerlaeota bacterium]